MTTIPASQPPAAQETPYLPPGPPPLEFNTFSTVNTPASRPAIRDEQVYSSNGFVFFGGSTARTMPGILPTPVYSAASVQITWFDFVNIGSTPFMLVLQSDGSIIAVNTNTSMTSTVFASGTILAPSQTQFDLTQWG